MYMSLDMFIMVVSSVVPLSLETAPAVVLQARASRVLFLNRCWLLEEPAADAEGILHLYTFACTCMRQTYMYMCMYMHVCMYVCCLHNTFACTCVCTLYIQSGIKTYTVEHVV